ncbi:cytochrome P450 [Streptomyces malaysiensis]|uniref:cytochrome P450 n=1 Tax=Streptomyces malaysiensis TaxID=92644 RepID=UPI002B27EDBA|nr:cytochrome P450 [Streptomyces malaysiensis]
MTKTDVGPVPRLDFDPFAPDVRSDPADFQIALRRAGGLVYVPLHGIYATGRYAEVRAAFVDWQSFESSAGVGILNYKKQRQWREPSPLIEADPPYHDATRRVLSRILSPRALRVLRDRWFADAETLVDELAGRTSIDAVTAITRVFPLRVFPDAVGIGVEGRESLLPYGNHGMNTNGPRNDLVRAEEERIARIQPWIDAQCERSALSPGGFGAQIWAAADAWDITARQAALAVRSLLTAGVDTTVNGIASVLAAFSRFPDQWRRLREDPSLVRVAFDEAVRLESPVQSMCRTAVRNVAIGDAVVPAGEKLYLSIAAANRDPRRWTQPDVFDLTRDPSGQIGFGMGIHQCVGQHVARLEAEALLTALVRRVSSLEAAGPAVIKVNNTLRTWDSLPLRLQW